MSGIAGIYHPDGRPADPMDLQRMVDRMAHRGPDGRHIWYEGSVGLGHCMLHTTPESLHEKFPMTSRCGNFVLTADARIDNRDELISIFGVRRHNGHPITDGELILLAYEKWGEDCPKHLLGDFAFAIWDKRGRRLFCARDHFGVKPFYYCLRPGEFFAFGSEIKSFLSLTGKRLNDEKLLHHLLGLFIDVESTFFEGVFRLPPATVATIRSSDTQVVQRKYYEIQACNSKLSSDEDYTECFRDIFYSAVRTRSRACTRIGSMLSGGLDSSAVTCVASDVLNGNCSQTNLLALSAVFHEYPESDESFYINKVLEHCHNIDRALIDCSGLNPLQPIMSDFSIEKDDEPVLAPNIYLNSTLLKFASDSRINVVLDGYDGDTTVSHGLGYLTELAKARHWKDLFTNLRVFGKQAWPTRIPLFARYLYQYRVKRLRGISHVLRALEHVTGPGSDSSSGRENGKPSATLIMPWHLEVHDLRAKVAAASEASRDAMKSEANRHLFAISAGIMVHSLEALNRIAAISGVELRFPFWDKRLVEYCLGVPSHLKLRDGWSRYILRDSLAAVLPAEIAWRNGKGDLSKSFYENLRNCASIDRYNDLRSYPIISNFINSKYWNELSDRIANESFSGRDLFDYWGVMALAEWTLPYSVARKETPHTQTNNQYKYGETTIQESGSS